jgi:hypothetical protein
MMNEEELMEGEVDIVLGVSTPILRRAICVPDAIFHTMTTAYKHHSRCAKSIRGDACDMPVDCARMNDRRIDSEHLPDILWRVSRLLLPSDPSQPVSIDLNAPSGSICILAHHPVSRADVKNFSWRIFKSEEVEVTRVSEGFPEFELRWLDGPSAVRRMQVRSGRKEWADV